VCLWATILASLADGSSTVSPLLWGLLATGLVILGIGKIIADIRNGDADFLRMFWWICLIAAGTWGSISFYDMAFTA
jgi:hypothetical protein